VIEPISPLADGDDRSRRRELPAALLARTAGSVSILLGRRRLVHAGRAAMNVEGA
jgi:hypothetical protein